MFARNTPDLELRVTRRYALRTPTPSAMFGRTNKGERCEHGYRHSVNSQISYPILSAGAFTATLAAREAGPAGAPKPRLLDQVREAIRTRSDRARPGSFVVLYRTTQPDIVVQDISS